MRGMSNLLLASGLLEKRALPYTHTQSAASQALQLDQRCQSLVQRATLCQSLAGNAVDVLTITAPVSRPELLKRRRGVVISGMVRGEGGQCRPFL